MPILLIPLILSDPSFEFWCLNFQYGSVLPCQLTRWRDSHSQSLVEIFKHLALLLASFMLYIHEWEGLRVFIFTVLLNAILETIMHLEVVQN